MGIGLMNYGSFTSSYGMQNIPRVDVADVKKQEEQLQNQPQSSASVPEVSQPVTPATPQASRIANLEDISLTFNREESFDYIGSESSITDLDISKAVSDSQKDSVLSGYQYFVGSAGPATNPMEDGIVILK